MIILLWARITQPIFAKVVVKSQLYSIISKLISIVALGYFESSMIYENKS